MEVKLFGKLVDCISNKSKDGIKDYFSLHIYSNGVVYRVGVPFDVYRKYLDKINEDVVLENLKIWIDGKYSLYVKA